VADEQAAAKTTRYIAFLRGINVGGHRVRTEEFRTLFTGMGFSNIETFLASGNVIFEAPADTATGTEAETEKHIERHLREGLGYAVDTFLRSPAELAAITAVRPFPEAEIETPGYTLHVVFLRDALGKEAIAKLADFRTAMDDFFVEGRELYWLCRGKTTESLVAWPQLTRSVIGSSTMRNMTTVRRLAARYPAG